MHQSNWNDREKEQLAIEIGNVIDTLHALGQAIENDDFSGQLIHSVKYELQGQRLSATLGRGLKDMLGSQK